MRPRFIAALILTLLAGHSVLHANTDAAGVNASRSDATRGESAPAPDPKTLLQHAADYDAVRAKTVVDLQKFRRAETIAIPATGNTRGLATLLNLNPRINSWYLLQLRWPDGRESWYHLINNRPRELELRLDTAKPFGVMLADGNSSRLCSMWLPDGSGPLARASASRTSFKNLCDGAVALALPTGGSRTSKEWAADFLRDHVPGGEELTVLVRRTLFKDSHLESGTLARDGGAASPADPPDEPRSALINPAYQKTTIATGDLGIAIAPGRKMIAGRWVATEAHPGVFVSAIEPGLVPPEILASQAGIARALDSVESKALVSLVAFDLAAFDVGFALGTDHPRVGWSERAPHASRAPGLPGPDGIDRIAPLVGSGRVPPNMAARVIATFVGGFKRQHGAFRSGALAQVSGSSHYGFIENGVVLSKLQPGLATVFALDDGRVEMRTWRREDDALLDRVLFARQNGVPIVESPRPGEAPVPGGLVTRWADGNWSGSESGKLRTLRSALAIQETPTHRFLIYAYFSGATPSAMARVLQAYGCQYGMPLDMNALEHTYLALYHAHDSKLEIEHLVTGMSVLEKTSGKTVVPRFLGYADNRDFFYVAKKIPATAPVPPAPRN